MLDTFDLGDTAATGACTDSFDVTVGSGRDYQVLCGTNTGNQILSQALFTSLTFIHPMHKHRGSDHFDSRFFREIPGIVSITGRSPTSRLM